MIGFFKRQTRQKDSGESFVWLTGMGLAVGLMMVGFILSLVFYRGLLVFWPQPIVELSLHSADDQKSLNVLNGQIVREIKESDGKIRWLIFTANKQYYGSGFRYVDVSDVLKNKRNPEMALIERRQNGLMIGKVQSIDRNGTSYPRVDDQFSEILAEEMRDAESKATLKILLDDSRIVELAIRDVIKIIEPNSMGLWAKTSYFFGTLFNFIFDEPREANTEGGIFPAIYGTFVMTLLMSVLVMPFGVLAAIYLKEYAKPGLLVRIVRISVSNLAGVPSIVFGVFGLGFWVYGVGGLVDAVFFSKQLPTPTFGTGGILWASLTLALMTVPVVIVATEEALSAVPRGVREASLACGASKWQTIKSIVLPASAPGIITGLILAMARGAGEVAPLMMVGVVKLAPSLPLDLNFPFVHLERKFMHLGFHIYDLGFQSPDSDAAIPMVFATTLVLILLVLLLNILAIYYRQKLARKYATKAF